VSYIRTGDDQRPWPAQDESPLQRFKLLARQAATVAVDLVFPPHCVGCERVGSFLCSHCLSATIPADDRNAPGFDQLRACAQYKDGIRAAIHALKYERQVRMVGPLGDLLAEMVQDAGWPIDLVAAVPLHSTRLHERGYNQAGLLGRFLAQRMGWEFDPAALRRIRATESQVNLTMRERRDNVAGAFVADAGIVCGKRVLVIDDVLTTGATLGACAEALRAAGAAQVFGAAVAGAVYSGETVSPA
jgi:ComF family protein